MMCRILPIGWSSKACSLLSECQVPESRYTTGLNQIRTRHSQKRHAGRMACFYTNHFLRLKLPPCTCVCSETQTWRLLLVAVRTHTQQDLPLPSWGSA